MLCSKCKTAVAEDGEKCGYCGAKIDKTRARKVTGGILVFVAALFAVVCGLSVVSAKKQAGEETALEAPDEPAPRLAEAAPAPEKSETEAEELKEAAIFAARTAEKFCEEFSKYSVYITNMGYLYEASSGAYITARDVIPEGLPEAELYREALLLYMKPSDVRAEGGLPTKKTGSGFAVFAAYETKNGFLIADSEETCGEITRETMQKLLAVYDNKHGQLRKVIKDGSDYGQIVKLLSPKYPDGFDFRYLYKDDKYCAALVSPTKDTADISGYLFELDEEKWKLGVSGYDKYAKYKAYVNARYPDCAPELLFAPLANAVGYISAENPEAAAAVAASGKLPASARLTFQCAAGAFYYAETAGGKKILAHKENEEWSVYEAETYESAVSLMDGLSRRPPLFILRQY
ncbi:MAG: hypothetical protein LBU36_06875 [Clostridiales bacterium]|jgi:hypothetical protein|nr:hypothetical protein [Clostridiales bacterium]